MHEPHCKGTQGQVLPPHREGDDGVCVEDCLAELIEFSFVDLTQYTLEFGEDLTDRCDCSSGGHSLSSSRQVYRALDYLLFQVAIPHEESAESQEDDKIRYQHQGEFERVS